MPIYEYQCGGCGKVMEVYLHQGEKPPKKCDICGAAKLKRIVSRSGFQLKGTGWYATDYPKKGKKERPECKGCEKPSCPAAEAAPAASGEKK
ncbi:MAG: zinc ribbon domain-containing protein [Myxococcota bacterium]|jgi:putative FmdB family regulatory protein